MIRKTTLVVSVMMGSILVGNTVACARPNAENILINNNNEITSQNYKDNFNFQTGPSTNAGLIGKNSQKTIHDFIAPINFSYVSYIETNGKASFFGDKNNMLNVESDDDYTKTAWKNEKVYLQWILIANKDVTKYKNLKVNIYNKHKDDIQIKARFNKFMKTKNKYRDAPFDHVMKKTQYLPDAIGKDNIKSLKGNHNDSYYDVYPVLIEGFVNKDASTGLKDFAINLEYEYEGKKESIERKFNIDVINMTLDKNDYGKPVEEKFGFASNQYAHRTMKYLNGTVPLPDNPDGTPNYVDDYEEIFANEKNKEVLAKFREPLTYMNNPSWWGDGFQTKKLIKYTATVANKGEDWTDEDYFDYLQNGNNKNGPKKDIAAMLKDQDVKYEFDFSTLNKYIEFAANNKVEEVTIDPIKQTGNFELFIKSPLDKKGEKIKEVSWGGDFTKGGMLEYNGKLSHIGETYLNTKFVDFLDALIINLNKIKTDPKYQLTGLSKIPRVTVLLDEFNEDAIYKIWDVIQKVNAKHPGGEKVNHAIFIGWRANTNWFDEDYLKRYVYDKIDRYIYHYRYLTDTQTVKNSDLQKVRKINEIRQKNGLSTYLYATWGDYPGAYLSSDLSEMYQVLLFALNLNFNGFSRWAYDWIINKDLYESEDLSQEDTIEGTHEDSEPGESWLVYGNDPITLEARPSMRLIAFMDAFEEVYKFKNLKAKFPNKTKELNKILSIIGNTSTRTINNDYKWYLNKKWDIEAKPATNGYQKTVAEQTFEYIYLLDKFAKNNL